MLASASLVLAACRGSGYGGGAPKGSTRGASRALGTALDPRNAVSLVRAAGVALLQALNRRDYPAVCALLTRASRQTIASQTGGCARAFRGVGFVFSAEPIDFLASSSPTSHLDATKYRRAPVVIKGDRAFVAGEPAAELEGGRWLFFASLS
jgi:hypothetical protein